MTLNGMLTETVLVYLQLNFGTRFIHPHINALDMNDNIHLNTAFIK